MYKFVFLLVILMFFVLFLLLVKKKLKCFGHKGSLKANSGGGWIMNEDKQTEVRKLNTMRSLYLRFYCVIKFWFSFIF
jgi:hypothetical protein